MVVGEGPGREEDHAGTPFVGQSGGLLRRTLGEICASLDIDPSDLWYTNAVRCRPPGNRDPLQDELDACLSWLVAEIEMIEPACILAVGKFGQTQAKAALAVLGLPEGLIKRAYHPAYILRRKGELKNWRLQLEIAVKRAYNIAIPEPKPTRYIREDELGTPDFSSKWLSADTETDSLTDEIGNDRVGWSVSDGVKADFYTTEPPQFAHVFLHEASYDLPRLGIDPDDLDRYDDTLIQAYVTRQFPFVGLKKITPGLVGLDWRYFLSDGVGHSKELSLLKKDLEVEKVLKNGKVKISTKRVDIGFSEALATRPDACREYAATDALATALDAQALDEMMDRLPWARDYYQRIEKPLIPVITSMQQAGVRIDVDALKEVSGVIDAERERTAAELREVFGPDINLDSNQQLGPFLLQRGLIDGKRTASGLQLGVAVKNILGAFGVEREEDLPHDAKGNLARTIISYRQMGKLKVVYIDAIENGLDQISRIHGRFNQAATNTNRLSSSDPNLQNIPARTKIGLAIRRAFVAREGCKLVVGDCSQLQLRILAEFTNEKVLLDNYDSYTDCKHAFLVWPEDKKRVYCTICGWVEGDFHGTIAKELGRERSVIKNFNFAFAFGAEAEKAAITAGVPLAEMQPFMLGLRQRLPRLVGFRDVIAQFLTSQGYVESLLGWRMYFPDWFSPVTKWRNAALREAVCGPIQSTEGGFMKLFMVATYKLCKEYAAQIVLQVHDELGIEVPEDKVGEFVPRWIELCRQVGAEVMRVPIRLNVAVVDNWAEAK